MLLSRGREYSSLSRIWRCSNSLIGIQRTISKGEAIRHGQLRNKCLQSSTQALDRNDGQAAKVLRLRGQSENDLVRVTLHETPCITELATKTLSRITWKKQSIHMQQLRHALAVEVGEARPEEENMPEMELVHSACAGLVVVIRGVVHFVTHSAYDFFKRTHEYWFPDAQSNIANIASRTSHLVPLRPGHVRRRATVQNGYDSIHFIVMLQGFGETMPLPPLS